MRENIQHVARRMFRHACEFADCADLVGSQPITLTSLTRWYENAKVVNSAFACEVFLKAMLYFDNGGVIKTQHKLKQLWEMIPSMYKELILCEISETNRDIFSEGIENISNAFVDWRYVYESDKLSINLRFLYDFRNAVREICCRTFFSISWNEFDRRSKGETHTSE